MTELPVVRIPVVLAMRERLKRATELERPELHNPLVAAHDRMRATNSALEAALHSFAAGTGVPLSDTLLIASFVYALLEAQMEVDVLEQMVGGENAPAALR